MTCSNCKNEIVEMPHYIVLYNANEWHFCGRICMTEAMCPELKKAVVPCQWIPTEEEKERMTQ